MVKVQSAIGVRDRAVYAKAYSSRDSICVSDGLYQAFGRDITDFGTYQTLSMTVLGAGGTAYSRLKAMLDLKPPGARTVHTEDSGLFVVEEKSLVLLRT